MKKWKGFGLLFQAVVSVVFSVTFVALVSYAGSLSPSASPVATSYTFTDIYTRLTTNEAATSADHVFTPASSPAASFYSLTQIYDAIPTIDPGKVALGTTYLGVAGDYPSSTYTLADADDTVDLAASAGNISSSNAAVEWWQSDGTRQTATLDLPTISNVCDSDTSNGSAGTLSISATAVTTGNSYCGTSGTLFASLFNGGGGSVTGGTQADGGVEDSNASDANYYIGPWTVCNSGNSYCGTGLSSADVLDNTTNLIWSYPCAGSGCSSFSDSSASYTWDNSGGSNNSQTASELCSSGSHGESGWSLPHQKQAMSAYVDGSASTAMPETIWLASQVSYNAAQAWTVNMDTGRTTENLKDGSWGESNIRCVRAGS